MLISDWSSDLCSSYLRLCPECRLDVGHKLLGPGGRGVAVEHPAVTTNQELAEVPFDRVDPEQAALLLLQPFPQRMRTGAVDLDLGEHREVDVVGEQIGRAHV